MEQLCKYDMYKITDRAHIRYGQKYGTKLKKGNQQIQDNITIKITRGSAIAEEPRDVLRQLKYYGRF